MLLVLIILQVSTFILSPTAYSEEYVEGNTYRIIATYKTVYAYVYYVGASLQTSTGITFVQRQFTGPNPDFLDAKENSYMRDFSGASELEKIAPATYAYNCHSYAWHSTSEDNLYWIDDIAPYLNDSHTVEILDEEDVSVGNIVVYYGDSSDDILHSAIVHEVSGGEIIKCRSKWGQYGVYIHDIDNVPDIYLNDGELNVKYYSYSKMHIYVADKSTALYHSRHCIVCGHTITEPHSLNQFGTRCVICGWSGPTISPKSIKGNLGVLYDNHPTVA